MSDATDGQDGLLSDLGVTAVPVARIEGSLLDKVPAHATCLCSQATRSSLSRLTCLCW